MSNEEKERISRINLLIYCRTLRNEISDCYDKKTGEVWLHKAKEIFDKINLIIGAK
jgi:hypothetical protein